VPAGSSRAIAGTQSSADKQVSKSYHYNLYDRDGNEVTVTIYISGIYARANSRAQVTGVAAAIEGPDAGSFTCTTSLEDAPAR
jgi:hypothetical protein